MRSNRGVRVPVTGLFLLILMVGFLAVLDNLDSEAKQPSGDGSTRLPDPQAQPARKQVKKTVLPL